MARCAEAVTVVCVMHRYFMDASPVRPVDYLRLFAEVDLLGALSACPGRDCGATHSNDVAACCPLRVDVLRCNPNPGRNDPQPDV